MSGSMKDKLEQAGLVAPEPVKPPADKNDKKKWLEPLPDDESLPPPFDAPALIKPTGSAPPVTKKK
jgi:hypothetical protein